MAIGMSKSVLQVGGLYSGSGETALVLLRVCCGPTHSVVLCTVPLYAYIDHKDPDRQKHVNGVANYISSMKLKKIMQCSGLH